MMMMMMALSKGLFNLKFCSLMADFLKHSRCSPLDRMYSQVHRDSSIKSFQGKCRATHVVSVKFTLGMGFASQLPGSCTPAHTATAPGGPGGPASLSVMGSATGLQCQWTAHKEVKTCRGGFPLPLRLSGLFPLCGEQILDIIRYLAIPVTGGRTRFAHPGGA